MDGLVAACKAALDGGSAPERHGAAPHISVLVKDETLAQAAQIAGAGVPAWLAAAGAAAAQAGSATASGLLAPWFAGPWPADRGAAGADRARHHADRPAGPGLVLRRPGRRDPLGRRPAARTSAAPPVPSRRACAGRWKPATSGCRWPCCDALAAWATAHHITPWSQGGATSLDDLALFCHLHHHYFIHLLGWTITGNPNGTLHFTHPGGWLTLDSPLPER